MLVLQVCWSSCRLGLKVCWSEGKLAEVLLELSCLKLVCGNYSQIIDVPNWVRQMMGPPLPKAISLHTPHIRVRNEHTLTMIN